VGLATTSDVVGAGFEDKYGLKDKRINIKSIITAKDRRMATADTENPRLFVSIDTSRVRVRSDTDF
jgi:hypothetical protein